MENSGSSPAPSPSPLLSSASGSTMSGSRGPAISPSPPPTVGFTFTVNHMNPQLRLAVIEWLDRRQMRENAEYNLLSAVQAASSLRKRPKPTTRKKPKDKDPQGGNVHLTHRGVPSTSWVSRGICLWAGCGAVTRTVCDLAEHMQSAHERKAPASSPSTAPLNVVDDDAV